MEDYKMEMYILDPTNYKGWIENFVKKDGFVAYLDKDLTFEQYKQQKGNENLIAVTWEDFQKDYNQPFLKGLQGDFKEITYDQWEEMLNCLPPMKWHQIGVFDVFFNSEGYTADLHSCYARNMETNKCYTALRSKFIKDDDLLKQLLSI